MTNPDLMQPSAKLRRRDGSPARPPATGEILQDHESATDLEPPVEAALDGVVVATFGELAAPRDAQRGVGIEGEIETCLGDESVTGNRRTGQRELRPARLKRQRRHWRDVTQRVSPA